MSQHLDPQEIDRSLRNSVRDGVAYSVMTGSGETYFAAFALFLNASAAQLGVLSALPPLLGSFAQLLSAWWGRHSGRRKRIILGSASMQVLSWLPLLLLPLLFPDHAVSLLILCVVLYYALGNLAVPQWSSLMGDLVPERSRGRYFSRRNGLMSVTNFLALLGAGLVLHHFERQGATFTGFAIIFGVALVARMVSVGFLTRMADPPGKVARLEFPIDGRLWQRMRGSRFLRFALFFAGMQLAVAVASPYFVLYMLRDLQFSYLQFTLLTAASVLIQFFTLNAWGRISDAFGNRLILRAAGACIPLLPALWLFSENFWYLMAVQAFGGFVWAGFSLCAGNFLYELVPAEKRVTYLAVHNVLAAVGVFIGALCGAWLAGLVPAQIEIAGLELGWASGLWGVFLLSALLRAAVALTFLPGIEEVRRTRRLNAPGLVLRATRSIALAGLVVDFIGLRKRRRRRAGRAGE